MSGEVELVGTPGPAAGPSREPSVRVSVGTPGPAEGRHYQFRLFEEQRAAAKDALQRRVLQAGLGVVLTGVCVVTANIGTAKIAGIGLACPGTGLAIQMIAGSIGFFALAFGCVLMMLSDVDLEDVFARRRMLARWFVLVFLFAFTAMSLLAVVLSNTPPVWLIPLPIWVYFGVVRLERTLNREPGHLWFNDFFVMGFPCASLLPMLLHKWEHHNEFGAPGTTPTAKTLLRGELAFTCVESIAIYWFYTFLKRQGRLPRHFCCWYAVCVGLAAWGLGFLWRGFVFVVADGGRDQDLSADCEPVGFADAYEVWFGMAMLLPSVCYLAFRERLRGWLTRRFYRQRRLQDGAFVAELAQPALPRLGDRHDVFDSAACEWHDGTVVAVHASNSSLAIDVQLLPPPDQRKARRFSLMGRDSGRDSSGKLGSGIKGSGEIHTIKLPGHASSAEELRATAMAALFGIRGDKITLELMSSSGGDAETHALAERCAPDDIDYFLSHSWHDDPAAKFQAIEQIVADFKRQHGRAPLLWLDKGKPQCRLHMHSFSLCNRHYRTVV
jgi:hypothetical protein